MYSFLFPQNSIISAVSVSEIDADIPPFAILLLIVSVIGSFVFITMMIRTLWSSGWILNSVETIITFAVETISFCRGDPRQKYRDLPFYGRNKFFQFRTWVGGISSIHREVLAFVKENMVANTTVVEIGCGRGFLTRKLYDLLITSTSPVKGSPGSGMIWSFDNDRGRVRHAARYCGLTHPPKIDEYYDESGRCSISVAKAENFSIGIDDEAYLVLCIMVAHHLTIELQEIMIEQIFKVLRPGRKALIVDHGRPINWYGHILWRMFRYHCYADGCIERIESMARSHGFICERQVTQFGWIHHLTIQKPLIVTSRSTHKDQHRQKQ